MTNRHVIQKSSMTQRLKVCTLSSLIVLLSALSTQSIAAPLPPMDKSITLMARETSVNEFLIELFGLVGVPVVVNDQVKGTVNGDWKNTAQELHQHTMKSFQLVTYYDGQVAHVYNAHDLQQRMLPVSIGVGNKIISQVNQLALGDQHNAVGPAGEGGLVVRGTPRFIEQVDEISRSVRRKSKVYVPQTVEKLFYLRHAWVQDSTLEMEGQSMVVPGIVSILNDLIAKQPLDNQSGQHLGNVNGSVSSMGQSELSRVSQVTDQATNPTPKKLAKVPSASGENDEPTRVVAVPRLNAVLVRDLESRMSSYAALIQELDVEPYMLEIEATIIDISTDRAKEFGVNWRYRRDDGNEALVGNGTPSDLLLNPGQQITPQGQGGILSLALGNPASQFLSRIRALETEGDAEIVSKPHVVTLSNAEAVLDTTRSFFVRVASSDDASLFKITAGTTLRVTPHVYRMDGKTRIKLLVNIEDGATSDAEVDQIPVIGNSTIRTQAIINDGDSLLVGGLVRQSKQDTVSKVPLLGDIPGLGSVFRSESKRGGKVERLFLITPRLAFRDGFNSGRRMDAPILQGSQGEIIGTSGQRLSSTKKALLNDVPKEAAPMVVSPQRQPPLNEQPKSEPAMPMPDSAPDLKEGQYVAKSQAPAAETNPTVAASKEQTIQNLLKVPSVPMTQATTAKKTQQFEPVAAGTKKQKNSQQWSVETMQEPTATFIVSDKSRKIKNTKPAIDIDKLFLRTDNAADTSNLATESVAMRKKRINADAAEEKPPLVWQAIEPAK